MSVMTIEQVAEPTDTQPIRRLPWTGAAMGASEDELLTSEEMLEKAGLNWDVAIRPLWRRLNDGTYEQHPRQREVYRVDNEQWLGTVKGRYELFSNREAFAFGDSLIEDGVGYWTAAGSQYDGSRVFMTMRLEEGFKVLDGEDYQMYLFIRTSHGDGTSVSASVVPFRVWCLNQSQLVMDTRKTSWSIPHNTSIGDKIKEARKALQLTADYQTEFAKLTDKLATVSISDETARLLIESVFSENRSKRDKIIADVLHTYHTSTTVEPYLRTGYGLLNGLTEYMDHVKTQRTDHSRLSSVMWGEGAKTRNALVERILELV